MGAITYAVVLALVGTFAAAVFAFVVGFAGAPGAILTGLAMKGRPSTPIPAWGYFLTGAGQLYASLAFVAFVSQTTASFLNGAHGFGPVLAWIVTFFVAIAPAQMALKDSFSAHPRNVQHWTMIFATSPITAIGFFVFLLFPSIRFAGWGWVPHL